MKHPHSDPKPPKRGTSIAKTSARTLVRRLGENRAFRRRLPRELGGATFMASTEGGLKLLRLKLGAADPPLTRAAQATLRPGMRVWDVGANVGLFAFIAAGMVGREGWVVAVEPDPWLAANLQKSARLNRLKDVAPVQIVTAAISDEPGVVQFNVARNSRATNFIDGTGSREAGGVRETLIVPTTTLDNLSALLPPPDFLKIDVERAEDRVFRGARKLLETFRPVLLAEVVSGSGEIGAMLRELGYTLHDADDASLKVIDEPAYTTLAVPCDRGL